MVRSPRELIERIRAGRPPISDDVLASAVGVPAEVIAAWGRDEDPPDGRDSVPRLAWIAAQAGTWYVQVMPVILGLWRPGSDLETALAGQNPPGPGEFFRQIDCRRAAADRVEYRVELRYSFDVLVFVAFGPERDRVRLARRADGPEGEVLRFTTAAWGPAEEQAELIAGSVVSLFVRLFP